jgi:regulatory protein
VTGKRSNPPSLQATALRLLATREHSRDELRRKLRSRSEDCEEGALDAVLDRLAENGLQSDARFAESYVRSKASRMGQGRLRRELLERGVSTEIVAGALEEALPDDELTRARAVWARKFGAPPQDRNEWARQARFLQTRGFAVDVIRKLLKEPFDESA